MKSRTVKHALSRARRSPRAQLLEKNQSALRWAQEQDCVNLRHIDALVKDVHGEEAIDFAILELLQSRIALVAIGRSEDSCGRDASGLKARGHELRVLNANTKGESAHLSNRGHLPLKLGKDLADARVVARI